MTPSLKHQIITTILLLGTLWSTTTHAQALEQEAQPAPERVYGSEPNYWLPVVEILLQQLSFNTFSRIMGADYAQITPSSMWTNLTSPWVFDEDGFAVNQIGHPYQGALYFTSARSSDLGFWTSALYTFMGSLVWEYFWETERQSINDQITTSIGGVVVGEMLHRLALAALWSADGDRSIWQWLGGLALEPMGMLNREAFGFAHGIARPPSLFTSIGLGYGYYFQRDIEGQPRQAFDQVRLSASVVYGLPGDPDASPSKPLKHFDIALDLDLSPEAVFPSIFSHAMLGGRQFEFTRMRGFWGFFVGQTYFSRGDTKLGTFDLGIGTSSQIDLGRGFFAEFSGRVGYSPMSGGGRRQSGTNRDYRLGPGAAQAIELMVGRPGLGLLRLNSRTVEVIDPSFDGEIDIVSANTLSLLFNVYRNHALGLELGSFISNRRFKDTQGSNRRLDQSLQIRLLYTLFNRRDFAFWTLE